MNLYIFFLLTFKKKIPPEISLSEAEWVEPEPFKPENLNRKPLTDRDEEIAIQADFSARIPSAEVVKQRAKYRPSLWFNLIPRNQRYMIFTTYGPDDRFDIESQQIGFEFFGCFETLEEAAEQIRCIRSMNPHAVFLRFHTVDVGMGKRIDLPPPNDGSAKKFHLNRDHAAIMNRHLRRTVEEFEDVESRATGSIDDLRQKNILTQHYNKRLIEHAASLLKMTKDEVKSFRENEKERVYNRLELLDDASKTFFTNPGGKNIIEQLNDADVKSLTYDQIDNFIDLQTKLTSPVKDYRTVYRRYTHDGKDYLVRCIQARNP